VQCSHVFSNSKFLGKLSIVGVFGFVFVWWHFCSDFIDTSRLEESRGTSLMFMRGVRNAVRWWVNEKNLVPKNTYNSSMNINKD